LALLLNFKLFHARYSRCVLADNAVNPLYSPIHSVVNIYAM